jgi:lipoprotein-releasing system permease protein
MAAVFGLRACLVARRYLRGARRREGFISVIAGFSFIGIMLGVATLIIVMAVMNGFRSELLDKVLGYNGHATAYSALGDPITDFDREVEALLEIPGVVRAMPFVEAQVMASTVRANSGALVRGMREADLKALGSVNNDAPGRQPRRLRCAGRRRDRLSARQPARARASATR